MISELLRGYIEQAVEWNARRVPLLLSGTVKLQDALMVCDNFRLAAIGELFYTGCSAPFRQYLRQGAKFFAAVLGKLPAAEQRTSLARPFYDAIAAGAFPIATTIASSSRHDHAVGREYEEEFLFHEIPMQLAFLDATGAALQVLLSRYQACLQGTTDARLPVLRALVAKENAAFEKALAAYLQDRATAMQARQRKRDIPGGLLATEWHFSLEGVALVRLARRLGLETAEDYLHVPALALEPPGSDEPA